MFPQLHLVDSITQRIGSKLYERATHEWDNWIPHFSIQGPSVITFVKGQAEVMLKTEFEEEAQRKSSTSKTNKGRVLSLAVNPNPRKQVRKTPSAHHDGRANDGRVLFISCQLVTHALTFKLLIREAVDTEYEACETLEHHWPRFPDAGNSLRIGNFNKGRCVLFVSSIVREPPLAAIAVRHRILH
jgi:hypothetical protein